MRQAGSNFSHTEDPDCSEIIDFEDKTEELLQYEHMPEDDVQQTVELPNHFRCVSHTLNLIAMRDAVKAIQKDIFLSAKHDQVITRCTRLWESTISAKKYTQKKKMVRLTK